jgi:hypothetical protein
MSLEKHEEFINRLYKSQDAVFCVAKWIHSKGYSIKIPVTRYKPYGSNPLDYVDDGDIYVEQNDQWNRFDVKHLSTNFTGLHDWPFKETIVSSKRPVDRANPTSKAYIIVNTPMTHIAIVWRNTREHWYIKELMPKNYQKLEEFYICPNKYVDFRSLSDG